MAVEIRPVETKKELKRFIYLPRRIYAGVPQWVPPLYDEERKYYDPRKNPAFASADARCFLAYRDGEAVGRIMGIVSHKMNGQWKTKNARFCLLESPDDLEVAAGLLGAVCEWAKAAGMETLTGPHGFSDQDPEGMLVKGFEHRATIATYYNFPYLPGLVEKCGFVKDYDYRVFWIKIPDEAPELYEKIAERRRRQGFVLVEFETKKELKPHLDNFVVIINDTFADIYGFAPLSPEEGRALIDSYLPIIDPHFMKYIYKLPPGEVGRSVDPRKDEVVGFIVGMPDITEGIQKAKGNVLPFGIFHILKARNTAKQLDLFYAGVRERYRNLGLTAMFALGLIRDARARGLEYVDAHQELEFNSKVHEEWGRFEHREWKRLRIFVKELVPGGLARYQASTAAVIPRHRITGAE
ncbi:MAG TPA: hypothetical protein ENN88_03470 [Candidatus Coatesbacteria bacterium]|nr:hypothetical protein [Candidatus Coatesbacteria bacterium]